MSQSKDVKRELEAAWQAIEALDARLSAGRLGTDEHARLLGEREREVGRLFVTLRRTQRDARGSRSLRPGDAPVEAAETRDGLRTPWLRNPLVMASVGILLLVGGVGGGLAIGRWVGGERSAGVPSVRVPPAGLPTSVSDIELQTLRQMAAREDAPIPGLLQFAHIALDQGRLDEARGVYQQVLAREPRNAEAITHMGSVLFQEGRVDEALARVEEALRIDPQYIHAHWDRTQYLFHAKRDYPAAIKAAEAFLQVVPDGPDAENIRKLIAEARANGARGAAPAPKTR
jgi:tetratricopeptide (TPR) repeat protein